MVNKTFSYQLGLDIGIASVGWALLDTTNQHIIDLGVRCFDKAETDKDGDPLNLNRRMARLPRRRLGHRRERLDKLIKLLVGEGLIPGKGIFTKPPKKGFPTPDLWRLRVSALDEALSPEAWARIIYHICKHRGFHWRSKAEEAVEDKAKETGRVKAGLNATHELMEKRHYRTAAEMVVSEFPDAYRNKQGEYRKALSRSLLAEEMAMLFDRQRQFGNPYATETLERAILGSGDKKSGILWEQKPALSGDALLAMLGHCTFEKDEYRAPKASFTAERHVLLTRINNMRVIENGETRGLRPGERRIAMDLPYKRKSPVSYKQLKDAWKKSGLIDDDFVFAGLRYPSPQDNKQKNPETAEKIAPLEGWHKIRKCLESDGLNEVWQQLADTALTGKPELLDGIAWALSVYKEDDEARNALAKLDLPGGDQTIEALLNIRFDNFGRLSLKALARILPYMEEGLRYDEVCREAGYHHALPDSNATGKQFRLPPFYVLENGKLSLNSEMDLPRNPVVMRALNQARKVVNAIMDRYGSPMAVHIEMARDLSRPFKERKQIEREQTQYRERNDEDRQRFSEHFGRLPKGKEFAKWQLYREQQGKCAYSLQALDLRRLLDDGYVEIDHALPYSRSYDDSKNNKMLCLTAENRNKGNKTPYEYLDGANDSERWRRFVAFVESNKAWRPAKKARLLRKHFGQEEAEDFRERNLNDTRYICRFFKNYVERYLLLHEESDAKRCIVVSGQLTSLLRARWGLLKRREVNDRHHALDAAVVAACTQGFIKRMADYSRRRELGQVREGFVDIETGEVVDPKMYARLEEEFPLPWAHFRQELLARVNEDNPHILREQMLSFGTYSKDDLESVRPLFVSRAPKRRNSGAAHKETIYGQPPHLKDQDAVVQRISVDKLKPSDLDKLVDPDRNKKLYAEIRRWVESKSTREKEAKNIEQAARKEKRDLTLAEKQQRDRLRALPRKPGKNGMPGPVVRNVKVIVTTQPIKSKWGNFPAKTNANASDALSPCFRQVDK